MAMGNGDELTASQFQEAEGVEDWRVLDFGASAWFAAPSQPAGAALVGRIAELTDNNGMPDVDLRVSGVRVRIGTSGSTGLTQSHVALARAISAAAQELGLVADPPALRTMQLTIDARDKPSVLGFWRAVLAYELMGDDDLVDRLRRDPAISFQQQDQPRPLRNRIHLDVARMRPAIEWVQAVTAAGGNPANAGEHYNPLADPEGNEVDLVPGGELAEGPETADWRILFGGMTFYPIASPVRSAELAAVVAGLADDAGLPMLVDLRPEGVTIDTGKDQWEDDRFPDLARRIQAAARGMALAADTTPLRFMQIGIDAVDVAAVRGFWRAVLGYEYDPRPYVTDIYDPRRLNPPVFFQQMEASEEDRRRQRNRIHVDLFVPHDQAQARIDAALAASGQIAHANAPDRWTLTDPEGNEVDIAISVGRANSG